MATTPPAVQEEWEVREGMFISRSVAAMTHRQKMAVVLTLALVAGMEFGHRISVNVLLPDMQGNVAADSDQISWVVTLYNLGFLCSMALAAWMTRVLGPRRHVLLSIWIYLAGAIGCVLSANSLGLLLASRLVMGFGGGTFLVRMVIVVGLLFPGKSRVAPLTWIFSILYTVAIFYPMAVGWVDDTFHWNYAFLVDVPFLVVGSILVWKYIPSEFMFRRDPNDPPDFKGAVLLLISLSCLQAALSRGERDMWLDKPWITLALTASVVCFVAFVWQDRRAENWTPVLHLRMLWRQDYLRNTFGVVLIVGAMLGAGLYVLPQYLRFVQDFSATQVGAFISAYALGIAASAFLCVRVLLARLGALATTALGLALMLLTCTLLIYEWTPTTPSLVLGASIFMQGFSLGPILLGGSNLATGSAPMADLNDVGTAYFFTRQIGNTLGVTIAAVMFDYRETFHSYWMLGVSNRLDPNTQRTLAQYATIVHRNAGGAYNPSLGALQLFQNQVVLQSRLLSYIDVYFGLALTALAGLACILIARPRRKPSVPNIHLC